jgi:hypothetical protein
MNMEKRLIERDRSTRNSDTGWLDLETLATTEITSEDPNRPVELAFRPAGESGWRASESGVQTIRLIFHQPQRVSRVHLRFSEKNVERTQEFVLRWAPDLSHPLQDIVRQQWNFSPHGATVESEDYRMALNSVGVLELVIKPDIAQEGAFASLDELRIG